MVLLANAKCLHVRNSVLGLIFSSRSRLVCHPRSIFFDLFCFFVGTTGSSIFLRAREVPDSVADNLFSRSHLALARTLSSLFVYPWVQSFSSHSRSHAPYSAQFRERHANFSTQTWLDSFYFYSLLIFSANVFLMSFFLLVGTIFIFYLSIN